MGYPLKIEGRLIEFPSKADAEAFLLNKVLASPAPAASARKANGGAPAASSSARMVADFLGTIAGGGANGVNTLRVMKAVGITQHQAFGNRGKNINKLLASLGFQPHEVYSNARNDNGDREWKAGPKMADAVAAIKKHLGGA